MKLNTLNLFLLIIFISCNQNNIKKNTYAYPVESKDSTRIYKIKLKDTIIKNTYIESVKVVPEKTIFNNFEISYLDYIGDDLQRIFIAIDTSLVYDSLEIKKVIDTIRANFKIDKNTNISFFTEIKYADYKTNLFINHGHPLPENEYYNWMNFYYLGEYYFETQIYLVYPNNYQRQESYRIE